MNITTEIIKINNVTLEKNVLKHDKSKGKKPGRQKFWPGKKILPIVFYYINRSISYPVIIKEASTGSRWEQIQRQ